MSRIGKVDGDAGVEDVITVNDEELLAFDLVVLVAFDANDRILHDLLPFSRIVKGQDDTIVGIFAVGDVEPQFAIQIGVVPICSQYLEKKSVLLRPLSNNGCS